MVLLVLGGFSASAAGASHWCESTSRDFQLISDLPESDQLELIQKLTQFDQLAEPFLPGEPLKKRSALKLVVFKQRKDFLAATGERNFAGYMQPSLQTNRLLIGPIRGDLMETALHEYAHYLLRNRTGVSLPMWFDEGLATLLGNVDLSGSPAIVGDIPVRRLSERIGHELAAPSVQQRLQRTMQATSLESWHRGRINEFYDLSWLLAHYLYFDIYNEALNQGTIRSSELTGYLNRRDQSLLEHLDTSQSALVRSLDRHLRRWRGPQSVALAPAKPGDVVFRCLTPLERDLALALATHTQAAERARELLMPYLLPETSAAVSPEQRVALKIALARIEMTRTETSRTDLARTEQASDADEAAYALIEEVLRIDPGNAEAMVLAADLSVQDCLFDRSELCLSRWQAANRSYRAALRQDPSRYDGILGVGLAELYSGRPGDAVNYLKVAYARAPWAAVINYYLGESYRMMGDSRASTYLENARNWAVLDIWRVLAEESLRLQSAAQESNSER